MARRPLTVLAAAAAATAALVATAPNASAIGTCNSTTDPRFTVTVCADTNSVIAGYIPVPYSVGSICVAGVCTPAYSGVIDVPVPNPNAVVVSGSICISNKYIYLCRSFSTELGPIHIG